MNGLELIGVYYSKFTSIIGNEHVCNYSLKWLMVRINYRLNNYMLNNYMLTIVRCPVSGQTRKYYSCR